MIKLSRKPKNRRRFEKKGAKRSLMPPERKTAKIEEMIRRYNQVIRKFGISNLLDEGD